MVKFAKDIMLDCKGASAVEYSLIAGILVLAIFGVIISLGGQTTDSWNALSEDVENAR